VSVKYKIRKLLRQASFFDTKQCVETLWSFCASF